MVDMCQNNCVPFRDILILVAGGDLWLPFNIFEDSETLSERDWNISGDKWLLERPVTDSTAYEAVDESNVSLGW